MPARKLFSLLTAAAIGGAALAAPAISAPLAHASETVAGQTYPEIADTHQTFYPINYYLLAGDTGTFDPVAFRIELPAGTTLTLDEGDAIEALRADGWSISVTDSVLTVTAPRTAEGDYQIPVIVTFPDQSTQASFVTMNVDYLVDIPLSIMIPVVSYSHLSQSSTSSTRA